MNLLATPFTFALLEENSFGPAAIWASASMFNKCIICLLIFLILFQIYIAIERFVMYAQSNSASAKFLKLFIRLEIFRRVGHHGFYPSRTALRL